LRSERLGLVQRERSAAATAKGTAGEDDRHFLSQQQQQKESPVRTIVFFSFLK
jgi:hypothetical protein